MIRPFTRGQYCHCRHCDAVIENTVELERGRNAEGEGEAEGDSE